MTAPWRWPLVLPALGVCLVIAAVLLVSRDREVPCRDLRLDAAEWKANGASTWEEGERSRRQEIADDVLRCDALAGDSRAEVESKLGRPNGSRKSDTWLFVSGRTGDFLGWRNDALHVSFDKTGRVTDAQLTTFER